MIVSSKCALAKHREWIQISQRLSQILNVALCKSWTLSWWALTGVVLNTDECRFIYADHSIAPLKITRKMLVRVLSYYQVMPSYLEFLFVFGIHKHSREQRFSGFRSELMLSDGHNAAIASLGRSGRQFQLCYNLKTVGKWMEKGQLRPSDENWSIRQGAFYHQFDVKNGNSLWIITRAGLDIKQRVESMTGKTGRSEDRQFQDLQQSLRSSLAVHLLLCHWSVENWRPYFQWSEETVEREVKRNVMNIAQSANGSLPDLRSRTWSSRTRWASAEVLNLSSTESAGPWRADHRSNHGIERQ